MHQVYAAFGLHNEASTNSVSMLCLSTFHRFVAMGTQWKGKDIALLMLAFLARVVYTASSSKIDLFWKYGTSSHLHVVRLLRPMAGFVCHMPKSRQEQHTHQHPKQEDKHKCEGNKVHVRSLGAVVTS